MLTFVLTMVLLPLTQALLPVAIVNEYPNDPISAVDDLIKRVVPSQ